MKTASSLTIITAAIALAIGAANAFGEIPSAGQPNKAVAYFHATELSTAAASPLPPSEAVSYFRANELRTAASSVVTAPTYRDAGERAEPTSSGTTPEVVTATSTGHSYIDWRVVVGLVIGVALGWGLHVSYRLLSSKPMAH